MFPPYAARPPVNGRTSPILRVNEQFDLALDFVAVADVAVTPTTAAMPATMSVAVAHLVLLDMTTGDSLLSTSPGHAPGGGPEWCKP
jgi:hypothetical protein